MINIPNITMKKSYISSNTVKVEGFFSLKRFVFDWIENIIAVADALDKI